MKFLINLDGNNTLKRSKMLALCIKPYLEANVRTNQLYLATHHVPCLYQSGVRYEMEPEGSIEEFAAIPVVIARGWGDCDDLAPWRVAELRQAGDKSKIRLSWKCILGCLDCKKQWMATADNRNCPNCQSSNFQQAGRKEFHVVVRRQDGRVEDPSAILGMGR